MTLKTISTTLPGMKKPPLSLLDQKFWRHFSRNIWEKKALVLRNVQSGLLEMSDAEVFELLVLYADRCRKQNDPTGFKFFIDGFKAEEEDVLQVLPEKEDESLSGYHTRMKALFPDYCLVCDELLQVNHKKQHLLTEFTDELYRHVGFPNRFSEMGLYLGNYRKTPFGVHVDSCGVFSFPVAGVKRFRLWQPEYVKKNPSLDRAFKYEKHKKASELLEAHPGDMTYWPSSAWHIAESDGSFSATWSLGVWVDQPHKEMISHSLKGLLERKSGAAGNKVATQFKSLHSDSGEVRDLPKAYHQAIDLLQSLSTEELQETFLKSWMQHISSQGFKTVPSDLVKISTKSKIRLRSKKSLILWQHSLTSKDMVYFSFGGITVASKKSGKLLKMVKELNHGNPCIVSDYLNQSRANLRVLQTLADAGALSVESGKNLSRQ